MNLLGIPYFVITHQSTSLGTLSYAFSKSIKTMCLVSFSSLIVFNHLFYKMNCLHYRSPWQKSNLVIPITLSHNFIVWLIHFIP